jgi:hypothetical protein
VVLLTELLVILVYDCQILWRAPAGYAVIGREEYSLSFDAGDGSTLCLKRQPLFRRVPGGGFSDGVQNANSVSRLEFCPIGKLLTALPQRRRCVSTSEFLLELLDL